MPDPFAFHSRGLESPARFHRTITPSDTIDLAASGERPRVIVCQTASNVAVVDDAMTAGQPLLFSPRRINATGTTATVVGWW